MEKLLHLLFSLLSSPDLQVVIVYDGGARGQFPEAETLHHRLSIIRTGAGKSADETILKILSRIKNLRKDARIFLASNDGGLRTAAAALGGELLTVEELLERVRLHSAGMEERLRRSEQQWTNRLGNHPGLNLDK
jgi:predicted RNA-binding protein with PIN domain